MVCCSNTGGEAIKRYVFDQRTRLRESLTMKELEEVTFAAAYSEDGMVKAYSLSASNFNLKLPNIKLLNKNRFVFVATVGQISAWYVEKH